MFFSVQQGLLQSGGHLSASFLAVQHGLSQSGGHLLWSFFLVQHGLSQFTGQALVCSAAPTEAPFVTGPKREPMSNAPAITAAITMNIRSIFLRFIEIAPCNIFNLTVIVSCFIIILLGYKGCSEETGAGAEIFAADGGGVWSMNLWVFLLSVFF